ncbi:MAG: hypothetical protein IPM98_22595 [Lewinellaceae bacterium]|nr:hypothetical protein [Lewinellaceae bacterium]
MPYFVNLTYFHFSIGNREVALQVAGLDGTVLGQAVSPLNFEDTLFSALNVLHRLLAAGGGRGGYHPNRAFIRKIGRIQASLLNITAADQAAPTAVQVLFEKYWNPLAADAQARACFSFDFAQQPPYTELAELPWEFLAYQNLDLAVGSNPPADFIRKIPAPAPAVPPIAALQTEALHVLLIISEPEPETLRRAEQALVAYRESYVYRLLRVYENMANAQGGRLRLRVLFQPRRAEIQPAQLQRRAVVFEEFLEWFQKNMVDPDGDPIRSRDGQDFQPHVVHFLGHVSTDERDEETVGCVTEDGSLDFVPFQSFAACFAAAPPGLLFLQAPEGVQLHRGPFSQSGLLAELAQKRLPYLLSFQHPVGEQGSLAFLRDLYLRLFEAYSVPAAVTAARARLSRDSGSFADLSAFGSPVLYTTLAQTATLHARLVSNRPDGQNSGESPTTDMEQMSLPQKINWYGKEIRRLLENSELEVALMKLKEIADIAQRSPDSNRPVADDIQNVAIGLIARIKLVKDGFNKGHTDYEKLKREYQSVTSTLLDDYNPDKLLAMAQKTPEKPVAGMPRLR